jgi:hypothetical protein
MVFTRGTFEIGTDGRGAVIVTHRDPTNDGIAARSSTAATTNLSSVDLRFMDNYTDRSFPNSPFQQADINNPGNEDGVSMRPVGVGLRVRFVGTELNKGGRVFLARRYDGQTNMGNVGAPAISGIYQSISVPSTRNWAQICYRPLESPDLEFGAVDPAYALAATVAGGVTGEAWEFEVIGYYEFRGVHIGQLTVSRPDPAGGSAVLAAAAEGATWLASRFYAEAKKRASAYLQQQFQGFMIAQMSNAQRRIAL